MSIYGANIQHVLAIFNKKSRKNKISFGFLGVDMDNALKNNGLSGLASLMGEEKYSGFIHKSSQSRFQNRIELLISHFKPQGGVAEIARKSGLSEGVIRSWRDGGSDPSRTRCIQLAEGTGTSLLWIVAGLGPMWAADIEASVQPLVSDNVPADTLLMVAARILDDVLGATNRRLTNQQLGEALILVFELLGGDKGSQGELPVAEAMPLVKKAIELALRFRFNEPVSS